MAAPNLNSSTLIATAVVDTITPADTLEHDLTTNAAASGHTFISLSLVCCNNSSSGVTVTVNWFDGANNHRITVATVVAGNSTFEACPTRKALLEGWKVKVTSGTTSAIEFQHHYLDCH